MERPETRTFRLLNLELALEETEGELRGRAARELGLELSELRGFRIARKALDARRGLRGREPRFVVNVDLVLDVGRTTSRLKRSLRSGRLKQAPEPGRLEVERVHSSLRAASGSVSGAVPGSAQRVAVLGAGPAGLFAAHVLAANGVGVTLIDRGSSLQQRARDLAAFHRSRKPNPDSNLLFGEGGAGTYSDGKLYTRIDDPLEVTLLEELVASGAPPEILYDARAHLGTDRLHRILPAMRKRLEERGVEFAWNVRLERLVIAPGARSRVTALETSAGEIGCSALVLAPGHSARDTWAALHAQGVVVEPKPFQLGIRVEHPQALIDECLFGARAELLGAASYQLRAKGGGHEPAVHTFCMCPGGRIVASVNEAGRLCTNGMSNSSHSSRWANAAVVTTFGPDHFGHEPFSGVEFQRALEERFFRAGGEDYSAPAQRVPDFLAGRESSSVGPSSYRFGTRPARLDELLPVAGRDALRRGLVRFGRQLPGFAGDEGLLVGLESRSAGPVRLPRERETYRALGFANLFPVGEGAGFAGGITSAAIDGARAAQALLRCGVSP